MISKAFCRKSIEVLAILFFVGSDYVDHVKFLRQVKKIDEIRLSQDPVRMAVIRVTGDHPRCTRPPPGVRVGRKLASGSSKTPSEYRYLVGQRPSEI